jgi:hypothetical protein
MSIFLKKYILVTSLILSYTLLFSCTKDVQESSEKSEFKTLPEIQRPMEKSPSFSERFAETRAKTEFIDDQTEKVLNQNKKPIIIGLIILIGLFIQSLISYRKS